MDNKRSADSTTIVATLQKRNKKIKQGDRVVVDVAGQQFMTSRTTLTAGSSYFSSLFSESWTHEDDEDGPCSCFLDQNPKTFGVLLDFMREGMVQVNDLANVKVLALSEYLGMDDLIFTIKVAAYFNLHPTFSGTEDEAQQAFDTAYGSSLKRAITSGLLPKAIQEQSGARETNYAIMHMAPVERPDKTVRIKASEMPPNEDHDLPILGALNWVHYHGYTILESKLQTQDRYGDEKTFSGPSFSATKLIELPCTHVLIGWNRPKPPTKRTFALLLSNNEESILFYAPHGGLEGPIDPAIDGRSQFRNSRWCTTLDQMISPLEFLVDNKYMCREEALEAEFKNDLHDSMEDYFPLNELKFPGNNYSHIYSRALDEEEGVVLS